MIKYCEHEVSSFQSFEPTGIQVSSCGLSKKFLSCNMWLYLGETVTSDTNGLLDFSLYTIHRLLVDDLEPFPVDAIAGFNVHRLLMSAFSAPFNLLLRGLVISPMNV